MRALLLAALVLAAVLGAGCTTKGHAVELGLITPGVWDVRGDTDYLLAWAHNTGAGTAKVTWSITGPDGGPLPTGWTITAIPESATLEPAGTKTPGQYGGYEYPDWTLVLFTLKLPAGQAAGKVPLELHAGGGADTGFEVDVHADRGLVSKIGSDVTVEYTGRFHDSHAQFDSGSFPTTLGSGATVPGFDFGLLGLAIGESAQLVIPPPFGYGYDPDPSHQQFAGKTLDFDVRLTALEA